MSNKINENREAFIALLIRITSNGKADAVVLIVQYMAGLGVEITAEQANRIMVKHWGNTTYEGTPVRFNIHGVLIDLDDYYCGVGKMLEARAKGNSHSYRCYNRHIQFNVNCTNVINMQGVTGDIAHVLYQYVLDQANKSLPVQDWFPPVGTRLGNTYKLYIVKSFVFKQDYQIYECDVVAIPLEELTIPDKYN